MAFAISAQAADPDVVEEDSVEVSNPDLLKSNPVDEAQADEPAGLDDAEELTVPQPTVEESDLDELRLSFALYKEAIANASYDEADTLAKRMVELTIRLDRKSTRLNSSH